MIEKKFLIILAVVACVAVVGIVVFSSGILSNNSNDEIDKTGSKITLVTVEDGFKVTHNGKEVKCEESFYVPPGTTEAKIKVYLPNGGYQVKIWPAHTNEDEEYTFTGSDTAPNGTWADVSLFMFGDGEYNIALRHLVPGDP